MKNTTRSALTLISLTTAALFCTTVAQAALVVPAGNSLVVNDTDLNIAWTQDANLFKTQANSYAGGPAAFVTQVINASGGVIPDRANSLDTPPNSGVYNLTASDFDTSTGTMNWWGANAWVNYLNSINYAGQTGWRLPTVSPVNGISLAFNATFNGTSDRGFNTTAVNSTAHELAHLYYVELGNLAIFDTSGASQSGAGVTNSGPFTNLANSVYWYSAEQDFPGTSDPRMAWVFATANGGQGAAPKSNQIAANLPYFGWAVLPGQVSAVPVPAAVWLMGSALVGLTGLARRRAGTLEIG